MGAGRSGECGREFSVWQRNLESDMLVILIVVMALGHTYVKIYQIVLFKCVQFTVWQFYLN